MRLLERDDALSLMLSLRRTAAEEHGRLVFVEGEAGIGKTSLLRAFRAALPSSIPVLFGTADPLSTPAPLGPVLDVAQGLDAGFAAIVRSGAPGYEVLRAFLAALRRRPGLVLMLDDLHWSDEATLDLLRFCGRRIDSTRVLVVGAYRDDEVGPQHPLRAVVGDLSRSGAVSRLPLHGLSVEAVAALASDTRLDPVELHARTAGNPFFVTEVIGSAPARIPPTVRDAVLARAAKLPAQGLRTLEAAATIGPTVDAALLADVIDHPAAAQVVEAGLLQVDGNGYAFRHEVARQAVLDATDPVRRRTLHEQVLRALEARPGVPVALLAHHAAEAGVAEGTLRHGRAAANEAIAAAAHREAVAHLGRVAAYADQLPEPDRATFYEVLGHERFVTAAVDLGEGAFEQAIELWRRLGEPAREARALVEVARTLEGAGRSDDGNAALRRAVDVGRNATDASARLESLNAEALLALKERWFERAIDLGRRAIALGLEAPSVRPTMVLIHCWVGTARLFLGDLGGTADLDTAIALGRQHGLDRNVARAYVDLAGPLVETFRFAEAEEPIGAGLRFMTERQLDSQRLFVETLQVLSDLHRGRWSEAGLRAAEVLAEPEQSVISRIQALIGIGVVRARRGDPEARAALDEALQLGGGSSIYAPMIRAARAELAWLQGDRQRAGDEAGAALDMAIATRQPWQIGELAWWRRQASETGAPSDEVLSAMAEPWRLQLLGRWREAARAWHGLECGYQAALALLESDAPDVERARAAFDGLGALPAAAIAGRRLRTLGVRSVPRGVRPSTRANPAGLTAREVDVLRLVAGGSSDDHIATRLFLSPRTVHHHVGSILRKLEVSRRGEAVAAARRMGIEL